MSPGCFVPLLLLGRNDRTDTPYSVFLHSDHQLEIFANVVSFETQGLDVNQNKRSVFTIFSSSMKHYIGRWCTFPFNISVVWNPRKFYKRRTYWLHFRRSTNIYQDCQVFSLSRYHFFCVYSAYTYSVRYDYFYTKTYGWFFILTVPAKWQRTIPVTKLLTNL